MGERRERAAKDTGGGGEAVVFPESCIALPVVVVSTLLFRVKVDETRVALEFFTALQSSKAIIMS